MARQDEEPTTIPEILDMAPSRSKEDKAWIGGSFEAVVRRGKQVKGTGWSFFTCFLHDPQNDHIAIKATADVDFESMDGELVEVSGNGISREQYLKGTDYPTKYEGDPEIKMGKSAQVQVIGSGRAPSGAPAPGKAAAATGGDGKKGRVPYGPAVGGSIETAERAIARLGPKAPEPGTPEWAKLLFEIASDVLRLNEAMENGKLAKLPSVRAGGVDPEEAAEKAEAQAKAKAERKAKEKAAAELKAEEELRAQEEANQGGEEELEDDIPF